MIPVKTVRRTQNHFPEKKNEYRIINRLHRAKLNKGPAHSTNRP